MNAVLNYDPADPDKMRLPIGATCGDCKHIRRCKAMFGHVETDAYCDWSPSRFAFNAKASQSVVKDSLPTEVPAIVFFPAGSLGEEVAE